MSPLGQLGTSVHHQLIGVGLPCHGDRWQWRAAVAPGEVSYPNMGKDGVSVVYGEESRDRTRQGLKSRYGER